MFIVNLRFSENKRQASAYMAGHNQWISKGFEDGIFLVMGSIHPSLGGSVIAHGVSREEIERRVNEDPFVTENVVTAEILEVEPRKTDDRLSFLLD